jgi:broad specificity phosphatase PhoE
MTELYLFRHGETDWNRAHRFQGHTDVSLNETGRQQAVTLQPLVAQYGIQLILSSDLGRAKETAIIAKADMPIEIQLTPQLRECHLGDAEGLHRERVIELFGQDGLERFFSIHPTDIDFGFPNGETKRQHLRRLLNCIEPICRSNPTVNRIGISSHGGSLVRLIGNAVNLALDKVYVPNCSMFKMTFDHASGEWHHHGQILK